MMEEYKGLDIEMMARGFYLASTDKVRQLRKYIVERQKKESIKHTNVYKDILLQIDELFQDIY